MKRYYCYGMQGYCERGNDEKVRCDGCKFCNGAGGKVVDDNSEFIIETKSVLAYEIFADLERSNLVRMTEDYWKLKEKYMGERKEK